MGNSQSKKGIEGVEKYTQTFSEKKRGYFTSLDPKAFGKIINSRREILIDFRDFFLSPHGMKKYKSFIFRFLDRSRKDPINL